MNPARRRILGCAALAACAGPAGLARAQAFPSRPITLVVGNVAGGAADNLARNLALHLGKRLNQSVVVENVSGAAGSIAAQKVARSAPDGYTLMVVGSDLVINPITTKNAGYTLRDFSAVATSGRTPLTLIAKPSLPVRDFEELVALSRKSPRSISIGLTGIASIAAISASTLEQEGRFEWLHVQYKGGAQAITDLMAGNIDLVITALPASLGSIQSGKVKLLGLLSEQRSPAFPDFPTVNESRSVKGVDIDIWGAVVGPAKMDPATLGLLNRAFQDVTREPAYVETQRAQGSRIFPPMNPEEVARFFAQEDAKYRQIASRMKLE